MSTSSPALSITFRRVADLTPNPRNARTHSRRQIRQIADSIKNFGFLNPILIDEAGMVVAGHGRLAGAKLLGITSVPTICAAGLNEYRSLLSGRGGLSMQQRHLAPPLRVPASGVLLRSNGVPYRPDCCGLALLALRLLGGRG